MKPNPVKRALREGKPQVGTWLSLGSPFAARFLARTGLPWLTVDMEHTHTDIQTAALMFGAIADAGCTPLARVSCCRHDLIKSVLDCGAMGIVVPMVMNPEEARTAVAACKYPPLGNRSLGGALHALNYGTTRRALLRRGRRGDPRRHPDRAHRRRRAGRRDLRRPRRSTPIFVGPNDLAASLRDAEGGRPDPGADGGGPPAGSARRRRGTRSPAGIHVKTPEDAQRRIDEGWQFIAVGSELAMMLQDAAELARRLQPRRDRRPTWRSIDAGPEGRPRWPVVLIGTLDTKGREVGFVRDLLRAAGLEMLDHRRRDRGPAGASSRTSPATRSSRRPGTSIEEVRRPRRPRPRRSPTRPEGSRRSSAELRGRGPGRGGPRARRLGRDDHRHGGDASRCRSALPKVMVSTLASGQTRPYVGGSDIVMVPPVADLAGLNRLTRTVLANAADALVGMVRAGRRAADGPRDAAARHGDDVRRDDPLRRPGPAALEAAGCEVIVFHATGVGGQAMERLIRDGLVDARARPDDDRAGRRAGRRHPLGRARSAGGGRRGRASRRSSASGRSTWSISGRWRRSPRRSAAGASTSTTRPSP